MKMLFGFSSILIVLSGCSTLGPVATTNINKYQLNVPSLASKCLNKSNSELQVNQMQALSPFNSSKMFYSMSDNGLSSYAYNQWASTSSEMFSNNIIQYLSTKCIYANVSSVSFSTNAQYRLNTQLTRLSLDTHTNKTSVNLIIIAQLVDNKTNSIIKSKIFNLSKSSENTPIAMVKISNQLNMQFLDELSKWVSPN